MRQYWNMVTWMYDERERERHIDIHIYIDMRVCIYIYIYAHLHAGFPLFWFGVGGLSRSNFLASTASFWQASVAHLGIVLKWPYIARMRVPIVWFKS